MPLHWIGILLGAVVGFVAGVFVGRDLLSWRLRRVTEHWADWLAQAADAAAFTELDQPRMILEDRIDQLAADFEVVAHLIGIERRESDAAP